ncbi:MAG: ATP-binding protein [Akkermansia sp.]|nr:ATP-binding protein [Akkermansia sp.]
MKAKDDSSYVPRSMCKKVAELSRFFPCVLLTGARQVGKSTLLRHMLPEGMTYLTLDDYQLAEYAKSDPMGFLDAYPEPLCIDEIQYAPQLFRAIKMKVDANRHPSMYWMTGSQRFHMMKGVSDSLAGRIGIVDLYTLSQRELYGDADSGVYTPDKPAAAVCEKSLCSLPELYERIWRGGYPELYREADMPMYDFYRDYVQTYVERDVRSLTQVGDLEAFVKLMRSAAMRTGQQLVYSDLARDAGVSPKTAAAWISILQASGIVELLEPYHVNTTKRLAKTPKLYFCDTGLCCWLAGWRSAEQLMEGSFAGAILETWVYGQLVRRYANAGVKPIITYYRDFDGAEVDFVLEENGGVYPLEVKRSSAPMENDLRWCRKLPVPSWAELKAPTVFCTAEKARPMAHGAFAFPISGL